MSSIFDGVKQGSNKTVTFSKGEKATIMAHDIGLYA